MSRKIDWLQVGVGAALAAGTILDVIPGDEVAGVPLGIGLILHGLKVI